MSAEAAAGRAQDAPLEDLMVAMDVVDTIRHRHLIVERELDAAGRRKRLIERLREIYTAQGIEVTDAALEAGVNALEKERFAYSGTPESFSASLARIYVRRGRWLKPLVVLASLIAVVWLAWYFTVQLPQDRLYAELPAELQSIHARIISQSRSDDANTRASELLAEGRRAIDAESFAAAEAAREELDRLREELELAYEIRIVSRPGESSGVWRIPEVNEDARNYYLIVEAIDGRGNALVRDVRNEEDGRLYRVRKWGVRVDVATFEAVAADKRDDGIIDNFVLGSKNAGYLQPEYRLPTTGATITEW